MERSSLLGRHYSLEVKINKSCYFHYHTEQSMSEVCGSLGKDIIFIFFKKEKHSCISQKSRNICIVQHPEECECRFESHFVPFANLENIEKLFNSSETQLVKWDFYYTKKIPSHPASLPWVC